MPKPPTFLYSHNRVIVTKPLLIADIFFFESFLLLLQLKCINFMEAWEQSWDCRLLTVGNCVNIMIRNSRQVTPYLISFFPHWLFMCLPEMSFCETKARASLDSFSVIKSASAWGSALLFQSPHFFTGPSCVFIVWIHALAGDNYSNTCSNRCACLIEANEINILNMLFFYLVKTAHYIRSGAIARH